MKTYTAHYYNPETQTEESITFIALTHGLAIQSAASRYPDLRIIEHQGQVIWQHKQSLYAAWVFENAASLGELKARLESFTRQIEYVERQGMELDANTEGGFLWLKHKTRASDR